MAQEGNPTTAASQDAPARQTSRAHYRGVAVAGLRCPSNFT